MAGDAGPVTEAIGAENRVRAAVAKAHHRRLAIELWNAAEMPQRICQVPFAGFDLFKARL
jgi:hypothetical protein